MSGDMELGIRLDGGDSADSVWEYSIRFINARVPQQV
jgi:hypothetical protein